MVDVINISLGVRGRAWVGWATAAGANVLGVVDKDEERLASEGEKLGFGPNRRFTSVAEAVRALRPNAAIACTPNHIHEFIIRQCLDLGIHLLIEKPMTENLEAAFEVVSLAESAGLQLAVSQQVRYAPFVQCTKQIVANGQLGKLTNGLIQFHRLRPTQNMKLPLLLNQAVHHFDAARVMLGCNPVSCIAEYWDPQWNGCDDNTVAEATFTFDNGVRIHFSESYVCNGRMSSYDGLWRLEGERGQLIYDGNQMTLCVGDQPEDSQVIDIGDPSISREVLLCRDFLAAVESGRPGPTSGQDNLWTLAMVFAVEASARLGRRVQMDELMASAGGRPN